MLLPKANRLSFISALFLLPAALLTLFSCRTWQDPAEESLPPEVFTRLSILSDSEKPSALEGTDLFSHSFPQVSGDRIYFAVRQTGAPAAPKLAADFLPEPLPMERFRRSEVYFLSLPLKQEMQGARYRFQKTLTTGTVEDPDSLNPHMDYRRPWTSRIILPGWEGETFLRIRKWKTSQENSALPPRDVFIWLPPGYHTHPGWRLPVVYMHDGQQIWDSQASAWGGWKAETAARELTAAGKIPPVIIVGVANSPLRGQEFLSWVPGRSAGSPSRAALSREYGRFFSVEVKNWVDATFRTLPGRESTAVAGSSNGSSVSLWLASQYPETFGLAAGLSGANAPAQAVLALDLQPGKFRIYLDCGGKDLDSHLAPGVSSYYRGLTDRGFTPGRDIRYDYYSEALHNEAAWAQRMPVILEWFFGKEFYSWKGEADSGAAPAGDSAEDFPGTGKTPGSSTP